MTHRHRSFSALGLGLGLGLGLATLLAACSDPGPGHDPPDGPPPPPPPPVDGAAPPPDAPPAGGLCDTPPPDRATSELRAQSCPVGADAPFYLRGQPYSRLVVEVDAMVGTSPRATAFAHLQDLLAEVADKPGGVDILFDDMDIPPLGRPIDIGDVRALEDTYRDEYPLGDTAVVYFLYVADPSVDDTDQFVIFGHAHRTSSLVIYQKTIDEYSGGLLQPSSSVVESTVVAHEMGHVLGLVNAGTPMVAPHQDTEHGRHCTVESCLMYWANNSSALLPNLLSGGVVPGLDTNCRNDLAAVRDAP